MRERTAWIWIAAGAGMLLAVLTACGKGPSGPSPIPPTPVASVDWTQPSNDVLDYMVGRDGMMALPSVAPIGSNGVASFLVDGGERLTMCGGGSCSGHTDFRVDDDYVWLVQDNFLYNSEWGRTLGTRWVQRNWRISPILWAYCGDHGDCPPCPTDTQECRQRNGYALLCPLRDGEAGATPIRLRMTVRDEGVVDYHGTVGKRHTIAVVYESLANNEWRAEISHYALGLGLIWFEDQAGGGAGWGPRQLSYEAVLASTVGYNSAQSQRIGW